MNIDKINQQLQYKTPHEIVAWALKLGKKAVVTTNFRPYESAILHLVTKQKIDIPVLWCDTGYNTPQTYKHAEVLIESLALNIHLYVPKQSVAHRNVVLGLPAVDDINHSLFTEQVKLEPFQRAMKEHSPEVWFTNLRKGQTTFRDSIDVVSVSKDGILKVSPFYHYTDDQLEAYTAAHNLPNEYSYFDPTKVANNRECGLHI